MATIVGKIKKNCKKKQKKNEKDIENAFKRIALLLNYRCIPYLMRYMNKDEAPWEKSRFRSFYITLARWCNQPRILLHKHPIETKGLFSAG